MSTDLHPFRSAPFTEAAQPARPFPWARFSVMVAAILAIHAREDIARWHAARGQREATAAAQGTARAEVNAAASSSRNAASSSVTGVFGRSRTTHAKPSGWSHGPSVSRFTGAPRSAGSCAWTARSRGFAMGSPSTACR